VRGLDAKLAREGLRAPPAVPPRFTQVPVAPQPTAGPMREEPALNSTSKSTLEACKHTVSVFRHGITSNIHLRPLRVLSPEDLEERRD